MDQFDVKAYNVSLTKWSQTHSNQTKLWQTVIKTVCCHSLSSSFVLRLFCLLHFSLSFLINYNLKLSSLLWFPKSELEQQLPSLLNGLKNRNMHSSFLLILFQVSLRIGLCFETDCTFLTDFNFRYGLKLQLGDLGRNVKYLTLALIKYLT